MNGCKKDTKTNCFKIISSRFFKKKCDLPSTVERKTSCTNEETFVKPAELSANETEPMIRTHKVEITKHNCSMKQLRPLRHQPRTVKCRKRKRTSKNTIFSLILRKFFYWCPCFCRCKAKSRRMLPPNICANSCPCDETLLNQLCFTCSDKGLKTSTENFKTITNTRPELNDGSRKTKVSSLKHKPEVKFIKTTFNDEIGKETEPVSSKNERKCKNDRTAVNSTNKTPDCQCRANRERYACGSGSQPSKPKPHRGFVFVRKRDNALCERHRDV